MAELAGSLSPRFVVGAILSALLVGIGVNALVLQRERHPAPLFAPPPPKIAAPAPVASPPAASARSGAVARAAGRRSAVAAAARSARRRERPARGGRDRRPPPRGEAPADNSRLVKEAQTALAKLGYAVKANGAQGAATDQALREFERAHGLPLSTDITPRLVKQLNAAARAAAH